MAESDEECELAHLVPKDDTKDATPPTSPTIGKIVPAPSSPTSNKMSSSGGGSLSSRTLMKPSAAPSLTPVPGTTNSRFLYVNPKLSNLSRRPSLLSDSSSRTPKDNNLNTRMNNLKRDSVPKLSLEASSVVAPPNSPNLGVVTASTPGTSSSLVAPSPDPWQRISAASSQLTTKALASESDTVSEDHGSSETLKTSSGTAGFNNFETLNYLKSNRTGHTGLRSVASSAFIKAFWASRQQQRNVQHHCFISDTTDVRQMEHALLQLHEDFHSGKLRAFAKDCMEQMQGIREQQERLTRLHFDLGARQELYAPLSDEGLRANQENMRHLMSNLQQLCMSIEKLQVFRKDNNQ